MIAVLIATILSGASGAAQSWSRQSRTTTSGALSRDLSGRGKAGWTIFVIVLPFLGVFTYRIARARNADAARRVYEA